MSHKTLLVNTKPHGRVHISQDDCPWLTKDKLPPHYKTMLGRDVPANKPRCSYCAKHGLV